MNKTFATLALLATVVATPAFAADNENFVGARVGATAGYDDVTAIRDATDVVYGVDAGVDLPVGDNVTVGVEAFSTNFFEDERVIGAAARVGYALNEDVLAFVRAGYSNYQDVFSRELDGLAVGGGLETSLIDNTYTRVEYRYTDFEDGVGSHAALVGVGLRF